VGPADIGTYNFNVQGVGTDPNDTTQLAAVTLQVVTTNSAFVLSEPGAFPNVKAGSTGTSGPITISSQDGFSGTVSLSCAATFGANSCSISPASVNSFPATASLTINGTSFQAGSYEIAVVGTSGSITNSLEVPFSVGDYVIAGTQAISAAPGGQATANLTFASSNFYSGQVNATCDATALSGAQCTLSPANPIAIGSGAVVPVTASINVPSNAIPNTYNISINTQDVTGAPSHDFSISLTVVQDYTIGNFSPASQSVSVGQPASYNFSVLPVGAAYSNVVTLSCAVTPLFVGSCALSPNSVGPLSNSTSAGGGLDGDDADHKWAATASRCEKWPLALRGLDGLAWNPLVRGI
jgi:hypothetical protein